MTTLNQIKLKYPANMGAPEPQIISNDNKLILMFFIDIFDDSIPKNNFKERNINSDSGIAIVNFNLPRIHKFGIPNDELIIAHPYYKLGLKPYSFFSVQNSDWLKEIKRIEEHHPYFQPENTDNLKHFILTFKDSTFECIAKDYSVEYQFNNSAKEIIGNLF